MGTLRRTGPQSGPNVSSVAQHESAELAMATQFDIGGPGRWARSTVIGVSSRKWRSLLLAVACRGLGGRSGHGECRPHVCAFMSGGADGEATAEGGGAVGHAL